MSSESISRDYKIPDAELMMFAGNFCNTLTRDLAELTPFGMSAAKITALKAKVDAFEEFPADEYYAGLQGIATEKKNNLYAEMVKQFVQMAWRVETVFGVNSKQYNLIRAVGIYQKTEDTQLKIARDSVRVLTMLLPELASTGLTAEMIDTYKDLVQDAEDAAHEQNDAICERDEQAQNRILLGNELYKEVVAYCEIGKKLFANTDPAKYNDYIIYTPSPGGLTAPKNFRFFRGSKIFTWDLVENATRYEVEMSLDQAVWTQIFYETWNEIEYDVPDGMSYYRVRAHNSGGFGDFCEVLPIEYYRILPAPENFQVELLEGTPKKARLTAEPVPTAELYMSYVSIVNIGAGPGEWTGSVSNTEPIIIHELVVGKRNYFEMQAQNEGQSSTKTAALYLDVVE